MIATLLPGANQSAASTKLCIRELSHRGDGRWDASAELVVIECYEPARYSKRGREEQPRGKVDDENWLNRTCPSRSHGAVSALPVDTSRSNSIAEEIRPLQTAG